MSEKKNPYRFTIKFNPNDQAQHTASDLLNNRTDKDNYIAAAILYYEQNNASRSTDSKEDMPALKDIYMELQEVKDLLQQTPPPQAVAAAPAFLPKTEVSGKNSELDQNGKAFLQNMFSAFSK